jgi:hypothetical protein
MATGDWTPTEWRRPRTGETPLRVKFRDGEVSKEALPAAKWNWEDRDYAFDIVEVKIEKEK